MPPPIKSKSKSKTKFYAVAIGRNGSKIYNTWDECKSQVIGHPNSKYKSFTSPQDATDYLTKYSNSDSTTNNDTSAITAATFATAAATSSFAFTPVSTTFTPRTPTPPVSQEKLKQLYELSQQTPKQIMTEIIRNVTTTTTNSKHNNNNATNKRRRINDDDDNDDNNITTATAAPHIDYDFYKDHDVMKKSAATLSSSSSSEAVVEGGGGVENADDDDDNHGPDDLLPSPSPPHKLWFHVMFDGGSRGNPNGHAGSGTHIITRRFYNDNNDNDNDEKKQKSKTKTTKDIIHRDKLNIRSYLGFGLLTNNQAEYNGLVIGLEQILKILKNDSFIRQQQQQQQQQQNSQSSSSSSRSQEDQKKQCRDITIIIQGDSDLIIKQMNGIYQCKSPKLKSYFQKSLKLLEEIKKEIVGPTTNTNNSKNSSKSKRRYQKDDYDIVFEHVYRDHNTIADGLANAAMDSKKSWMTTTSTPSSSSSAAITKTNTVKSTSTSSSSKKTTTKKKQTSRGSTKSKTATTITTVKPSKNNSNSNRNKSEPESGLEV